MGAALLMCGLTISAAAAAKPSPPSWVNEDEYIVYENDSVYGDRAWELIEKIREFAENGGTDEDLDADMRAFLSGCATWYATFGMRYVNKRGSSRAFAA